MAKKRKQRMRRNAESHLNANAETRIELPLNSVPADLTQQAPHNSYSAIPLYYVDKDFTCCDCGKEETWTATQQKWWYEVAKGSIYSTAIRCRECRRKLREANQPTK
jgi:hypothetical protein